MLRQRSHVFLIRTKKISTTRIFSSWIDNSRNKQEILTRAWLAGVEERKKTVVTSIAWSGTSRRNLSPISDKADKRATWSPCNNKQWKFLHHLYSTVRHYLQTKNDFCKLFVWQCTNRIEDLCRISDSIVIIKKIKECTRTFNFSQGISMHIRNFKNKVDYLR